MMTMQIIHGMQVGVAGPHDMMMTLGSGRMIRVHAHQDTNEVGAVVGVIGTADDSTTRFIGIRYAFMLGRSDGW